MYKRQVNINAVEDYKEVSERYEFMQKQHEDIVTAEAHLTGLMEELEDAMRRQFNAKFKDIKRVFQEVFVELFGGGEARLELTDDAVSYTHLDVYKRQAMNGVDAIAFTAGLGENDDITRKAICEYLGYLGTELDEVKNDVHGETAIISTDDSKVTLLCVPTNEELMIARDTVALVK